MQAGNAFYRTIDDLPRSLPILALPSLVLLPGGFVPVTIEEIAMIEMINDALRGDRLIGVTQPLSIKDLKCSHGHNEAILGKENLYEIGCIGRITHYSEIGDGSVLISLQGICRFRLKQQLETTHLYPVFLVEACDNDLTTQAREEEIDRDTFLRVFRNFLDINDMQADWDTILQAPDEILVNALSIIAPFESQEKQALLEADDLKLRSETLIAIAERHMMRRRFVGDNVQRSCLLQ